MSNEIEVQELAVTEAPLETVVLEQPIETPVETVTPVETPELSHIYQPTDENGKPIGGKQVLKYKTTDELIAKMQDQNVLLIRKLRSETKKTRLGIVETEEISADAPRFDADMEFNPKQLTADQRVQLSRDLLDPERFDEVTDTLFEAKLGVKPQAIGQKLNKLSADNLRLTARIEADAFVAANTDYVRDEENFKAITNWMMRYNLAPVRSNFQLAFDTLKADGLLITAEEVVPQVIPAQTTPVTPVAEPVIEPVAEPIVPAIEPEPIVVPKPPVARISTGLTREQSADTGTIRTLGDDIVYEDAQKRVYRGLAAVNKMPSDVFKHRVNHEKGFAQKVEKLEAEAAKNRNRGRQ